MTATQPETAEQKLDAFLGIDIGFISTKGVIIDCQRQIIARSYQWTEGDPVNASRRVITELGGQIDQSKVAVRTVGTTGSARRLVGAMCDASVIKNEITAHAVGTTFLHPDVRTILEIGGQDSKIICVDGGIAVDYAMNTLCAAGTGAFLSSQAHRLGVEVEQFGEIALTSKKPANIAARCTVFAESDLVHKIQVGYAREDIIAGLCKSVAVNYLNNVGKGKNIIAPVVFQGGVSKNIGVVKAFRGRVGYSRHRWPRRTPHGRIRSSTPCSRRADICTQARRGRCNILHHEIRRTRLRRSPRVRFRNQRNRMQQMCKPLRDHLCKPRRKTHRQLRKPLRKRRAKATPLANQNWVNTRSFSNIK